MTGSGGSASAGPATRAGQHPWDVVVVGAGPAGATAARVAAERGCSVLLLERAAIPRYKPCGGGLIGAALACLPPDLTFTTHDEVREVTFSMNGRRERTFPSRGPWAKLVSRTEFDAALTDAAAASGAAVRDRSIVTGVEADDQGVTLRVDHGERVRARAVVGADGSASRIAKHVGVRCRQVDFALELELPVNRWHGRALIEWGPLPSSFGWIFPKGESCSVGVVGSREQGPETRAYLRTFLERHGLADVEPIQDTGHLTRCRLPDSPLARGRVLVAGDAAGLLDPWLREGISFALRSGALAGRAAARIAADDGPEGLAAAGRRYAESVDGTLAVEMTASEKVSAIFAGRPALVHGVLTSVPIAWRKVDGYLTGTSTIPEILGNPLIRLIVAAAGAVTRPRSSATHPRRSSR